MEKAVVTEQSFSDGSKTTIIRMMEEGGVYKNFNTEFKGFAMGLSLDHILTIKIDSEGNTTRVVDTQFSPEQAQIVSGSKANDLPQRELTNSHQNGGDSVEDIGDYSFPGSEPSQGHKYDLVGLVGKSDNVAETKYVGRRRKAFDPSTGDYKTGVPVSAIPYVEEWAKLGQEWLIEQSGVSNPEGTRWSVGGSSEFVDAQLQALRDIGVTNVIVDENASRDTITYGYDRPTGEVSQQLIED